MRYIIPKYIETQNLGNKFTFRLPLSSDEVEIFDSKYFPELLNIIKNGTEIADTELSKFLINSNILIGTDNSAILEQQMQKLLNSVFKIIIMPTEACNFRCLYCYENHNKNTLTEVQINHIKTFFRRNINNFKTFAVNWFGGEPTLCKTQLLN